MKYEIDNIFSPGITNEIQDSVIEYLDWYLLNKGNYFNTSLGETSPNGQDYSLLSISSNSNFSEGSAWEAYRSNWVWQSGISHNPNPLVGVNPSKPGVSGVYVDDNFYPSDTTGPFAHNIDHFNGRIVFDSPIPTSSKVQAEYSFKYINVIYASSLPWFREIQKKSMNISPQDVSISTPPELKVQLPLIAIELAPTRSFKPFCMGGFNDFVYTDIIFYCVAEDELTKNKMIDIISFLNGHSVSMFSSKKISENNDFPIDYNGYLRPNAKNYDNLISNYLLADMRMLNTKTSDISFLTNSLYGGVVRMSAELIVEH